MASTHAHAAACAEDGWGPESRPQREDPVTDPARLERAATLTCCGRTRPYRVDAPWAGSPSTVRREWPRGDGARAHGRGACTPPRLPTVFQRRIPYGRGPLCFTAAASRTRQAPAARRRTLIDQETHPRREATTSRNAAHVTVRNDACDAIPHVSVDVLRDGSPSWRPIR